MPKGTRVHRCVEKVKRKGGGNPFAICQAATGQSFATGKSVRSKMPAGVKQSPTGDVSAHREAEAKAVSRKLKAGKAEHAGKYLPFHPDPMQGDTPGLSVRQAQADKVV